MTASPARSVEVPAGIEPEYLLTYMAAYLKARSKGKPSARARQSGLRAVKAARKKAARK